MRWDLAPQGIFGYYLLLYGAQNHDIGLVIIAFFINFVAAAKVEIQK